MRSFIAEVQWKILVVFPAELWITYGPRVATPAERAAYNLMLSLSRDMVPLERLK